MGASMKLLCAVFLALVSCGAVAEPLFYVLDVRHTGDAVIHASSKGIEPAVALPYIFVDSPGMKCCFKVGLKPGHRKPLIKVDEDAPRLSSEEGEETFQVPGYVNVLPMGARGAADTLAFGLVGMTSVAVKGKRTYEIVVRDGAPPVIVGHCLGAEGVNFRLYHRVGDAKPYATYYYALGYDTEPDCR
jgi:hypothetical protein